MDEGAAVVVTEDGAEGRPHSEDDTPQNYIKAMDSADSKYLDTFATNCEESECLDTPMLTTLTSACFAAVSPICFPENTIVYLDFLILMYTVWKHNHNYFY